MRGFDPIKLASWASGGWDPEPPKEITSISTDTRTLAPGALYVALRGERWDGHAFVPAAFAAGAIGAVVEAQAHVTGGPFLRVADTRQALGGMAVGWRRSMSCRVVAVTGSVGKTTVKEMTAAILGTAGSVCRSPGNWNNEVGVPLSLLSLSPEHVFGVFELGMSRPGELSPLSAMVRPDWGIVTEIGPVHFEAFNSVDAIACEKAVLLEHLGTSGLAFLTKDHAWYPLLRDRSPCRTVSVSMMGRADYEGRALEAAGRMAVRDRLRDEEADLVIPLPGEHNLRNALLAIAAGREAGLNWNAIQTGLQNLAPMSMRWERLQVQGIEVINDAYNASPLSMRAALAAFAQHPVEGRRWLALGGMLELGASEKSEHISLGREAARGPWAGLVAVGWMGEWIAAGAREAGWQEDRVIGCPDTDSAGAALKMRARPGDAILIKASRGERLERIIDVLRAEV